MYPTRNSPPVGGVHPQFGAERAESAEDAGFLGIGDDPTKSFSFAFFAASRETNLLSKFAPGCDPPVGHIQGWGQKMRASSLKLVPKAHTRSAGDTPKTKNTVSMQKIYEIT